MCRDDDVVIIHGHYHQGESKVVQVYRRKLKIRNQRAMPNEANGQTVPLA